MKIIHLDNIKSKMKKDFDNWNKIKKNIDRIGEYKFYKIRDIWWCSLVVNIRFEQDGRNTESERPLL